MNEKQEQMSWRKCVHLGVLAGVMVFFLVIPGLFWLLVWGELKPRQIWEWVKARDMKTPMHYVLERLES